MAEIKNVEKLSTDSSTQIIKDTILVDASNQPIDENVSVWVFKCRLCNAEFERLHDMAQHIVKVHDGKKSFEYNLKCDPCDKVFSRRSELKLHIDKVHEGKQLFICVICNKQYKQAYTLKMHYKTFHGENDQVQGNLLKVIDVGGCLL